MMIRLSLSFRLRMAEASSTLVSMTTTTNGECDTTIGSYSARDDTTANENYRRRREFQPKPPGTDDFMFIAGEFFMYFVKALIFYKLLEGKLFRFMYDGKNDNVHQPG